MDPYTQATTVPSIRGDETGTCETCLSINNARGTKCKSDISKQKDQEVKEQIPFVGPRLQHLSWNKPMKAQELLKSDLVTNHHSKEVSKVILPERHSCRQGR